MGQQAWLPLLSLVTAVSSLKPIDVYWNISNPIFSAGFGSGYENVIEVNRDTHPWEYDQVSWRVMVWSCQQLLFKGPDGAFSIKNLLRHDAKM